MGRRTFGRPVKVQFADGGCRTQRREETEGRPEDEERVHAREREGGGGTGRTLGGGEQGERGELLHLGKIST